MGKGFQKGMHEMFTKSDKNYLLNMALVIVSAVCVFTGFFFNDGLRFAHEISGYLMTFLILAHLVLHLQWIKSTTKSMLTDRRKLNALLLTIVISIGVCAILFLNRPANHRERDNFRGPLGNTQSLNKRNSP